MLEKTINRKTYVRTGNPTDPDGPGANYFVRQKTTPSIDEYRQIARAKAPVDRNPKEYPYDVSGRIPREIDKYPNREWHEYSKDAIKTEEQINDKVYNKYEKNPISDANRKAYFSNEDILESLGLNQERAKEASNKENKDALKNVRGDALDFLTGKDTYDFDVEEPENDNIIWIKRTDKETGKKQQFIVDKNRGTLHVYENGSFRPVKYREMMQEGWFITPDLLNKNIGEDED